MSRVFLARDVALDRLVVVKVLPPDAAAGVSADRFKREIMLAARLQHPHIVPLLTAGEVEGLPFFTMPFVEGESLRTHLAQHGELGIVEAVRLLRAMASALAYAHEHGVVHRDIKPDNLLLSGDTLMITDFGVAKALSASSVSGDGTLTTLGVALGTPAYMSPEQASADPLVDHRTDIYAFGVVAYEMLTGQPPFTGRTPQALIAAHVTEIVEPIERRRSALPRALGALVMRCLEKRPADRPQSAMDIVRALDEWNTPGGRTGALMRPRSGARPSRVVAGVALVVAAIAGGTYWFSHRAAAQSGPRSIAVLPFENGSRDTSYDYFAEGLSDELRNQLTGLPNLSVKARTSSGQFRAHGVDPREVGAKLGVSAVLTGIVRRSADHLQVTTELVDGRSGDAIWSQTFDQRVVDLAAVRDSIATHIADALRIRLVGAGNGTPLPSEPRGTRNPEAYDLFLRGQFAFNRFDFEHAVAFYAAATRRDPNFARAHARLAVTYADVLLGDVGSRDSLLALAKASRDRAVALDSASSFTRIADAVVRQFDFRFADADRVLDRVLTEEPDNSDALIPRGVGQ
ncbi:MAG: protein kinase, partial [Gemmatimonadaceae bacterium]